MRISDCWSRLPVRGLTFAAALAALLFAVGYGLERIGFEEVVEARLRQELPPGVSPFSALLVLSLATIYLTEFMSNTVVATALFTASETLASALQFHSLPFFITIGMASTCAFMTPVATPVNSLAFGELPQISLWRMGVAGFFLNLFGALLVALTTAYWLPFVIGICFNC